MGLGGRGEFSQTGGSATVSGDFNVGQLDGSVGTLDLSGALLLSGMRRRRA